MKRRHKKQLTLQPAHALLRWWPAVILIILGLLSMGAMGFFQARRGSELKDLRNLDDFLTSLNGSILELHDRLSSDSLETGKSDHEWIISRIDSALSYRHRITGQALLTDGSKVPAFNADLRSRITALLDSLTHLRREYVHLTDESPDTDSIHGLAGRIHRASHNIVQLSTSLRHELLDHTEADLSKYHEIHRYVSITWGLAIGFALLGLVYLSRRSSALTGALASSEKDFRLLYEDAPLAYQSLDSEGRILSVNEAWLDLTGYRADDVVGRTFRSFLAPDSAERFVSNFGEFKATGEVRGTVFTLVRADQSAVEVSIDGRFSRDPARGSIRTHCILHDVTERLKSENVIRTERKRLFELLELLPGFVYLQNKEQAITFANREFRRLFGDPRGRACHDILQDRERPCEDCNTTAAMESGTIMIKKWESAERTYRVSAYPFVDSDGTRLILKLGVDITDLIEKERQLQENKEKYENLYNNALAGLFRTRIDDGIVIDCNDRFAELFGFKSSKEMIGVSARDYYADPGDRDRLVSILKEQGHVHDFETRLLPPHGKTVWVLDSVQLSPDGQFIDGVMTDITDRKRTQAALQATEERMKLLTAGVEQSAGTVCITDPNGNIQYVNPAFEKITGYSAFEVYGKSTSILCSGKHPDEFYAALWNAITAGYTWSGNMQNRRKDGEIYWERRVITPVVDRDGTVTNYVAIGEDITRETVAQQKLMEADKMAAIGMLAAGVAHEFKNYLGGIIGNASFALDELDESDNLALAKETLNGIIEMGERANEVAMSLLTYSRARPMECSRQNLRTVIDNTIALVEKELHKRSIELITYFEDTPEIEMAAGKIQQLLMNLIINAEQAITSSGIITVALFKDRTSVRLVVGDSGTGIAEENLARVFDPFFSTKGVWGKDGVVGTGIGLSICRNIAREHSGDLSVESIVGVATTFTLTLPVSGNEAVEKLVPESADRRRRILIFSMNNDIFSRYFKDVCAEGLDILTLNSLDKINENIRSTADVVICDARFTGMMELITLADILYHRTVSYLVVNGGGRDYQLAEVYQHARVTFNDLPEFDKLKKYLLGAEEAVLR